MMMMQVPVNGASASASAERANKDCRVIDANKFNSTGMTTVTGTGGGNSQTRGGGIPDSNSFVNQSGATGRMKVISKKLITMSKSHGRNAAVAQNLTD